ncbi:hypothetical protein ACFQE5_22190 [Pseudonocardia hispaniensis]|uniref:Uncharacterized protein n=1 Tax=Pseudonocardia hispaniensis TaxID=904933 RepID=A0ABW1J8Q9_9PSEU
MSGYYDRQGNPITLDDWVATFRHNDGRVALDTVGAVTVSTVHLGIDHSFGSGRPLIFETMVLGGPLDEEQARYSSEVEAVAGHQQVVARVHAAETGA